ncbi:hypothetical protein ACFSQD_18175 [Flavihumibacter stibioxidans]|uniref:Uncharacterized protein n=1 Tax=Flavihumibacter stibioxidans TaxID=1834163 RepID=A0ABR7M6V9_9BACT|nr:hypothetical protein [Flavihumibacter stibioxidans]MBC6490646.1 hypothetical protein [Flavihumibacter stibioxidans]
MKIFFLISAILLCYVCSSQDAIDKTEIKSKDTTIVGMVIDQDSVFFKQRYTRSEPAHYFGVHHVKIGLFVISRNQITDTLVIAYVFNYFTEVKQYFRKFGLKKGDKYVFAVSEFNPCQCDFPKLQGICGDDGFFLTDRSQLIKRYKKIHRIIFATKWRLDSKKRKNI